MAKVSLTTTINAPVEETFQAFSNVPEFPAVISGISKVELLTTGPVGVGTRFRETRLMYGREATEEMEFTEYQPHQTYLIEAKSHGMHYLSRFDFRSSNDGTNVEFTFEGRPQSLLAKIMSPMAKLMMGSVRKAIEADFDDLKAHLESRSDPPSETA